MARKKKRHGQQQLPVLRALKGGRYDSPIQPAERNFEAIQSPASIQVVRHWWKEAAIGIGLALALVVPSLGIIAVVVGEWYTSASQRGWLILGFGFYIVSALRFLWMQFYDLCERMCFLRVELRRMSNKTLFEAVSGVVADEAEKSGSTCSWDQEAIQEHDKLTGNISVKLRFWSSRHHTVNLHLGEQTSSLRMQVQYFPGEDVVCGRDSRVERREMLVLSMQTSCNEVLKDKSLLCKWLEQCYTSWVKPLEGVVNIYALQESSSDWVPSWALERVKPCKSLTGTGQTFFLERHALQKILADAKLWATSALRVYMIAGPPGVGKSEFTIWLAGQLGLPIYRVCLSSPRLTDERFAQLLSMSSVTHNEMLIQVDEFQETVQRWLSNTSSPGVTPSGFCECLQGSVALGKGIVVLTGTDKLKTEEVQRFFPAVFRRIHRIAQLGYMSDQDVRCFFRQFLVRFVPSCSQAEWTRWEGMFMACSGPWAGARSITVDMLKQFLMQQITEASCLEIGAFKASVLPGQVDSTDFQISTDKHDEFFNLICCRVRTQDFFANYALKTL